MPEFVVVFDDIFNRQTDAIVNPVNTVGVMGAGLAKQFKDRFPWMYKVYKISCDLGHFKVGEVHWYRAKDYWLVNFPTKTHWRNPSELHYITQGLISLSLNPNKIDTISLPALGCGLGGLRLTQVKSAIRKYLSGSTYKRVELVLYRKA